MAETVKLDVSEEAVCMTVKQARAILAGATGLENSGMSAFGVDKLCDAITELRRQLTDKEAECSRAVLAGVKAGIEAGQASTGHSELYGIYHDCVDPEAIAAKVKP